MAGGIPLLSRKWKASTAGWARNIQTWQSSRKRSWRKSVRTGKDWKIWQRLGKLWRLFCEYLLQTSEQHVAVIVLMLLSFVWSCALSTVTLLVGRQEGHPACKKKIKNCVMRCWHGYLSGARCKWFAYGPADATVTPSSLVPVKSRMVYLTGAGLPRLSWKKAIKYIHTYIRTYIHTYILIYIAPKS